MDVHQLVKELEDLVNAAVAVLRVLAVGTTLAQILAQLGVGQALNAGARALLAGDGDLAKTRVAGRLLEVEVVDLLGDVLRGEGAGSKAESESNVEELHY